MQASGRAATARPTFAAASYAPRAAPVRGVLALAPLWLLLPSLVLTVFVIGYPVYDIARSSLHEVNRFGMLMEFAGAANFAELAADDLFWDSLWRTLVWTVGVVAGTILASIPVALILSDDFAGRNLARIIVMLPWAVSLTMSAVVWRWALDGQSGMVNATLRDLGLIDGPVVWLADASLAFPWQIFIGVLVSIPFTVTVFLGGLSSIPQDIYEAAAVDGASRWSQFTAITLPLMKPFINIAIVLNILSVFNSFPIIWVLTEGGPANQTDILVTYLYKLSFIFGHLGKATAMSLIMFAILLAFTILYVRMVMRDAR